MEQQIRRAELKLHRTLDMKGLSYVVRVTE